MKNIINFFLVTLTMFCVACGGSDNNTVPTNIQSSPTTTVPARLVLQQYSTDLLPAFRDFDGVGVSSHVPLTLHSTVTLTGSVVYRGYLSTFDDYKTEVYVVKNANAPINRAALVINGGTGTDPRFFILEKAGFMHKNVVILSQRGLYINDFQHECALDSQLISCLRAVSQLDKMNPRDNGRDVVDLINIISGTSGTISVNGTTMTAQTFFTDTFSGNTAQPVNVFTGSYGATILAYALADPDLLPLGRVFIEGPSAADERVISDGFRNTNEFFNNLATAVGMNTSERTTFINFLKTRHTAPSALPMTDVNYSSTDSISTAILYHWMSERYFGAATTADITAIKSTVTSLINNVASADAKQMIVAQVNPSIQQQISWERHIFDLFNFNFRLAGFTSRFAQICSAYIVRQNGDSQMRFDQEIARPENDPYWYGFLIQYRQLLRVCDDARENFKRDILVPVGNFRVMAEQVVQYGAGLDEKHHRSEMTTMENFFNASTMKVMVYKPYQGQGGQAPRFKSDSSCRIDLQNQTFQGDLAGGAIRQIVSGTCAVQSN